MTIREDGRQRRVTAAEAFLLHLTRRGLAGDGAAARALLAAIEVAKAKYTSENALQVRMVLRGLSPGSVGCSIEPLGIAIKLNRYSADKARFQLKPWIVQAAVDRLGKRQLSEEEQMIIVQATKSPETIKWPCWWSVQP